MLHLLLRKLTKRLRKNTTSHYNDLGKLKDINLSWKTPKATKTKKTHNYAQKFN